MFASRESSQAFLIVSLILMINLLIAMMSATFASIREDAVLESRLAFAAMIIRLEVRSAAQLCDSQTTATSCLEASPERAPNFDLSRPPARRQVVLHEDSRRRLLSLTHER